MHWKKSKNITYYLLYVKNQVFQHLLVNDVYILLCLCDLKKTYLLCKIRKKTENNACCMHLFFLKQAKFST